MLNVIYYNRYFGGKVYCSELLWVLEIALLRIFQIFYGKKTLEAKFTNIGLECIGKRISDQEETSCFAEVLG